MKNSLKAVADFYARLLRDPVALCFAVGFLAIKVWSNMALGGRFIIGIRSGAMGLITSGVGLGLIHLLSQGHGKPFRHEWDQPKGSEDRPCMSRVTPFKARLGLSLLISWWFFWAIGIVDRLQRQGDLGGTPIFSGFLPVIWFDALLNWVGKWHMWSVIPGLKASMIENILRGQFMLVLVPVIMFTLLKLRRRDLMPIYVDIRSAVPFLLLYVAGFLFAGLSMARVTLLIYAFLYPGITEEFFYRGGVQPLLLGSGARPSLAIALAALFFAFGHIPDFVFRVYSGMLPLALGQVASVALYGTFLGYGVYRSGLLWPWMVIHAFSDLVS